MASEVSIVNNALAKLGDDVILSLDDDSKRARLGKLLYADTRDSVLRAHPWNFALARAQLAQLSGAPAFGYSYRYQLPSDPYCLRVLRLQESRIEYAVEGRQLLTNEATAKISYIARVTDPAQFDPLFIECLSARLAAEMAYPITSNGELGKALFALYGEKLKEAAQRDAIEGTTAPYQGESFTGLDICNQALGELGLEAVLASDEDTSRARLCRAFYAETRDAVLRSHPWNFATKRAALSAASGTPLYGYAYHYSLPADCLRVLGMANSGQLYAVEGRRLLTDEASASIRYVAQITDTTQFDALFTDVLIARLASRLALPLTQNAGVAEAMFKLYQLRLQEAERRDAVEGTTLPYQGESFTGLDICNQALGELGLEAFTSADDDAQRLRLCRLFYAETRDAVLRAHPWNFATKRAAFSLAAGTPLYGYAYQYSLPADCLRVLGLERPEADFVVEGRRLLTDESPANVRYVAQITDTTQYDALFTDALIARLASRLALPLTQNGGLANLCWAAYQKRLAEARAMDGLEGTAPVLESDDLLEVR